MKFLSPIRLLSLLFVIGLPISSFAQNVVLNGSFEDFIGCPSTGDNSYDSILHWTNPYDIPQGFGGSTPDYYNACATGWQFPLQYGVPANGFGHQLARTGVAYSGIIIYGGGDFREYIQVPLVTTLEEGKCYQFELFFSMADKYRKWTPDIQVYFSDTLIELQWTNQPLLTHTPHMSNPLTNMPDSSSWTQMTGEYIANGTEAYLLIGNFKDNSNTTHIVGNPSSSGPNFNYAYAYIDDVSLIEDPFCFTGIANRDLKAAVELYPNPTSDQLSIDLKQVHSEVSLSTYNVVGQMIDKSIYSHTGLLQYAMPAEPGIYFIRIATSDGHETVHKVIKQ